MTQESFFEHPCLCLHIPSFQGLWLDLHQLVRDHAGHTRRAYLRGPFSHLDYNEASYELNLDKCIENMKK